jgi:hypothetical protein
VPFSASHYALFSVSFGEKAAQILLARVGLVPAADTRQFSKMTAYSRGFSTVLVIFRYEIASKMIKSNKCPQLEI